MLPSSACCCVILAGMDFDLAPAVRLSAALDDSALAEQRPAARALLVTRLEALNRLCDEEMEGGKDLVRWGELKLRIVDRLMKLYKVDGADVAEAEESDSGEDLVRQRALVSAQMDDLAEALRVECDSFDLVLKSSASDTSR